MLHAHNVAVVEKTHELKFPIFVPLVLEHLLDGHHLARLDDLREENHPEAAVSDDTLRTVCDGTLSPIFTLGLHRVVRRLDPSCRLPRHLVCSLCLCRLKVGVTGEGAESQ